MKNKYAFTAVMLSVIMLAGVALTNIYLSHEQKSSQTDHEFCVITSFYPMYIIALNIIGECPGVTLQNLSEPQTGCMHDYQLTTEDMKKLAGADAFVVNGGGIENFLADTAARYPGLAVVNACRNVELMGDNAHAWMSTADYMTQVQTVADSLAQLDKAHKGIYQNHCREYLDKLEELYKRQQAAARDAAAENVIIFHEAFAYTARDMGLTVSGSMDLDEERQVSAGETAEVIRQIQEHNVRLILAEELYGREMCETVQRETDVDVVYLDTCVRGNYEADSYLDAADENLRRITNVLAQ